MVGEAHGLVRSCQAVRLASGPLREGGSDAAEKVGRPRGLLRSEELVSSHPLTIWKNMGISHGKPWK